MSRPGWWELSVVAVKLGFGARVDACKRLVLRLVRNGVIDENEFSTDGWKRGADHARAKNRRQVGLAPSADKGGRPAHARTPEAAAFRREAFTGLAESQTSASVLSNLCSRVEKLEKRIAPVESRVEKLESRVPEQLALPMATDVPTLECYASLLRAWSDLDAAVHGALGQRGLTVSQACALIKADDPHARPLRDAVKRLNGGRMPGGTSSFGRLLRRVHARSNEVH